MPDCCGFVRVGTVNAEVFDFAFLLRIKSVEEVIETMAVLASHHFQWFTCCRIQTDRHKTLAGPKELFVYQYALYILQSRFRDIIFKHFLINAEYGGVANGIFILKKAC